MQTAQEHYEKIKNGICPLCGSDEGFGDMVYGEGEFETTDTYCISCNMII